MIDLLILFGVAIGLCVLLAWLDSPRSNPARYTGKVYDPQPRPEFRGGAERVGFTGRMCDFCGVATFGYSDRCGKCHRLPVRLPRIPTIQTPASPLASEAFSPQGPFDKSATQPRHDPAAAPASMSASSLRGTAPAPASRGTRRRRGGSSR